MSSSIALRQHRLVSAFDSEGIQALHTSSIDYVGIVAILRTASTMVGNNYFKNSIQLKVLINTTGTSNSGAANRRIIQGLEQLSIEVTKHCS